MRCTQIVYLDCIHAKVGDSGAVRIKAVGVNLSGEKELLGLWVAQTEGAKFWLQVVTELKNRGVQDISMPVWMATRVFQRRLKQSSRRPPFSWYRTYGALQLELRCWKLRKAVAADLRTIYAAAAAVEEAKQRLTELDTKQGRITRRLCSPGRVSFRSSTTLAEIRKVIIRPTRSSPSI